VEICTINDLHELIQHDIFSTSPRLILGGGSNMLLTRERFDGLVIKNNISGKDILQETSNTITIRV
jgi:UDP-N-acetylmuramate dehydrogenase